MTTCVRCGKEGPDHWFEDTAPRRRCEDHLRVELRDVKAVNARMACEVIDLRAAVLAVARRSEMGGQPGIAKLLREACGEVKR